MDSNLKTYFKHKFKQPLQLAIPQYAKLKQGTLEYAIFGQGIPILAIHGGIGGYDQSLILLQKFLPDGYQLIAPSRPGYLGTALSVGVTIAEQTDLLAELLDYLNIDKALLIGISAGGLTLYDFAIRYPLRVRGIIAIDAISGHYIKPKQFVKYSPMLKFGGVMSWLTKESLIYFPELTLRSLFKNSGLENQVVDDKINAILSSPQRLELFSGLILTALDYKRRLLGTNNDISQAENLSNFELIKITAPALIIHGTHDDIVHFKYGVRAHEQISSLAKDYLWIENGTHLGYFFTDKETAEYAKFAEFIKQYA